MSNSSQLLRFMKQLKNEDVGIVINNVGMSAGGSFLTIDPFKMEKQVFLNFYPMHYINEIFVPKLREHAKQSKRKGVIVNVCSATGVYLSPGIGAYSASKHMADIYSRTLSIENKDNIDIISARPFGVITSMMSMRKV